MTGVVLASRSVARAKLLLDAGIPVRVRPSPLNEASAKADLLAEGLGPCELAAQLAEAKALALDAAPDEVVIGADQTLDLDGEAFDKPSDHRTLHAQLERLQGRTHRLHSAATLVREGRVVWAGCSTVSLGMRRLTPAELDQYVEAEGPNVLDCVGGYRLEGRGVGLFEAVEGEYFAVLGLPLLGLLAGLRAIGIGS